MAHKALGPATLEVVQAVRRTVSADRALLVAVSGGADSLALAVAVHHVAAERTLECAAITIDHGLQTGSAQQAAQVVSQLTEMGYGSRGYGDVVSCPVEVEEDAGPEADARAARYAVLDREASVRDADLVLGHTRDDQAETVLLGLTRGSGIRSLAGMSTRSGRRLRPLLSIRRSTTLAACQECGLSIWQDPHNTDARFTRARIRQSVLPVLESELGPGIADALARTADLARADADLLDALAGDLLATARDEAGLDGDTLVAADPALRGRVLKMWLTEAGAEDISATQVRAVDALVTDWHGQGPLQLPGLTVVRRAGRLVAVAAADDRSRNPPAQL